MTISKTFALAAVLSASVAMADDAETENATEQSEEKPAAEAATNAAKKPAGKTFFLLPMCSVADGAAEVRTPESTEWVAAEVGRHYALGSRYRTHGGKLVLAFGAESRATIEGESEFGTRMQTLSDTARTIVLAAGAVSLELPREMPSNTFFVAAFGFKAKNLSGESKFELEDKGDGELVTVRCVTGAMSIEGRHYEVVDMSAADEIKIRNTRDNLETMLYGTSGDYAVKIDRGVVAKSSIDAEGTVSVTSEQGYLDWVLSPSTKVRISRRLPAIGERMSVAVMTFDASGEMKNHFAFAEGRAEVNTGELVKAPKADAVEDKAKIEAAKTEETVPVEEDAAEDAKENSEKEKNNDNNKEEE